MSVDRFRVAVVTETYPPEVNGVAVTLARVVEGLLERGHTLELIRPRQHAGDVHSAADGFALLLIPGLPIPRYPGLKMGLPGRRALLAQWRMRRPDAVHIATEGPLGWSALQAASLLGIPVVTDFRTNFQAYGRHYGLTWLVGMIHAYLRHFHNRAACTMVPTESLREQLHAAGYQRLRVVARGVDTDLFDPARRSDGLRAAWGVQPDGMVALYVGRLAAEKNLDALLAAFSAMRRADPALKLVLVGEGPERARLQRACPDAVFAGVRRGADLAAHDASADLFLFTSQTETFGNVVPESMASGLAVVAFDHAAAGALIEHGSNGLLAAGIAASDFFAAAQSLAGQGAMVRQLGTAARSTAAQLGWTRTLEAIESEYASAIDAASAAPAGANLAAVAREAGVKERVKEGLQERLQERLKEGLREALSGPGR